MQMSSAQTLLKPWQLSVLRSSQLDAGRLDKELISMLKGELLHACSLLMQLGDLAHLEPETTTLLSLIVFAMSVGRGLATPASQLLNLRYSKICPTSLSFMSWWGGEAKGDQGTAHQGGPGLDRYQKLILAFGSIILPYAWGRLAQAASQFERNERMGNEGGWRGRPSLLKYARAVLKGLETTCRVSDLMNLAVFLNRGVCRNLAERMAGARLVYRQARMTKMLGFDYLNHQLIWQEISELILLVLPILNSSWIRRLFMTALSRLSSLSPSDPGNMSSSSQPNPSISGRQDTSKTCPLCSSQDLLLPFQALPCHHVFCYYCLRSNCDADRSFKCPIDNIQVEALRRHYPEEGNLSTGIEKQTGFLTS